MRSHVAVPVESVFAVQVSDPLRVNVTGSPEIGADVVVLVKTPDTVVATLYSPVAGLTVKVVGSGAGALTPTVADTFDAR